MPFVHTRSSLGHVGPFGTLYARTLPPLLIIPPHGRVQFTTGMVYSHLRVLVHNGTCSHAVLDVRPVVSFVHHEAPYGGLPPVQEYATQDNPLL